MPETPITTSPRDRVNPAFVRIADYCWRILVVGVVVLAALWLIRQVRVVFFPVVIALFLARALSPVAAWLRRHRWRPGFAAIASMLLLFLVVAGLLAAIAPSFADEVDSIEPTLTSALDDVEDWLVDDSPFNVSHADVDRLRARAGEEFNALVGSESGAITDRATLIAEMVTGVILAIFLTFFMIRDGARFANWLCERVSDRRRQRVRRSLDSAWATLAGYLRGATMLGVVESIVIGGTLLVAGAGLIGPVIVITFMGAYIPLLGAIVAGSIAVLVALVTAGTGAAIAVAIVALLVQQFDNDLLAPIVYGRTLNLHPVVILLSVVAGGALFGLAGTVLAVPVVAVAINATKDYRAIVPAIPAESAGGS